MGRLTIHSQQRLDGTVVLAMRGELDHATVAAVADAVDEALRNRPARMCLDLALVPFIDSVGISGLIRAHWAARRAGCELAMINASPFARSLVDKLGLAELLQSAG
ncbi:MAG TPA: STAS domain-containing protein [Pilimelia sp.]|nr:STAS domain-containing protein [Pilimelia sp.]